MPLCTVLAAYWGMGKNFHHIIKFICGFILLLYATSVLHVFVKVFSLQLSPAELIKQRHFSSKLEHIVSFSSLRKLSTKPGHSNYENCSFSVMQHLCYNHIYSMVVGWRVTTQLFIKWNW